MARETTKCRQANRALLAGMILVLIAPVAASAEPACRTGGVALANAYVRVNPINAYYFGSLESYVSENRQHFQRGGDAIRCAMALARAFLDSAIQVHDPNDLRRQRELNAEMGAMGIDPGPPQATPSQQLYAISTQLSRLARVLPPAADGNYQPLYTPTNELEQMQLFAGQMFQMFMQDPSMAAIMAQIEPIAREGAQLEYRIISQAAAQLGR